MKHEGTRCVLNIKIQCGGIINALVLVSLVILLTPLANLSVWFMQEICLCQCTCP